MKYFDKAVKCFLAAAMLFATGLLFVNVVLRYAFHSAIFWTEEMLRYLLVWITFIGASTCVQEDSHIAVDVLSMMLKDNGKRTLSVILHIAGILFSAYMLFLSTRYVIQIGQSAQVSSTIGSVPMYIIYLCFPVGFLLYVIQSVRKFIGMFVKSEKTPEEGDSAIC